MKRFFIFSAVFLAVFFSSWSQSYSDVYWLARHRLREKFIFPGTGQGEGYAAAALVKDRNALIRYYGDNTTYHGWYLGVLATEYAWLRTQGKPASATAEELFEALAAVQRLDSLAETYFMNSRGAHGQPAVNGFFIRDDVNEEIARQHGWKGRLLSDYELGCSLHPGEKGLRDNEMSQDQAIHLLLGLRLVNHFVEDSLQVQGRYLKEWARQMAVRIIRYIAENRWIIYNPVTGRKVYRGPDARLFSLGFAKTIRKLGGASPRKPVWYSHLAWPWLRTALVPVYFNRVMVMILGVTGNAYGTAATTRRFLCANGRLWKKEIYPLLHEFLEPEFSYRCRCTEKKSLEAMLASADATAFRSYGPYGWNTTNRWLAPAKTFSSYDGFFPDKEVTGLDFMLLHNLYMLKFHSAKPSEIR
ncbi:MAG: hypothetical protein NZM15_10230 [Flavobacteriales bacterium]|nr:hypothetical protein [Flavobacteriales bacterium]MDW8433061.1 hypothetical protein [Flavobacteriales bacterium]